jgi:signal transduction histidine kinase
MAWVGYAENDADKTVEVVAAVGFDEGYLKHVRVSWADQPRGRGPTGTCIRTAQVCIGHDFATEPALAPWREEALKRGYRSSIALPLMAFGKAFGALTLYSEAPGFFDEGRVTLLRELADDLAFGVIALRAQVERDHARAVSDRRAEQLRALASELTLTEQRERRRLAQILHDHLQQLLVGVKLNIGVLRSKAKTKTLQQPIDQISDMMNEAIRAARSLTAELSPPVLHEKGLAAGLEWLGRQMQEKHGLEVEVAAHPDAEPDAESTRIFLFGAVRELLFNIVKHAGTNRARVSLVRQDSQIRVTVADDGVGFDPGHLEDRAGEAGGFGLFSIRERLGFMGGYLEIDSAPARGSRFTLVAPLRRRGAPETAVALPAAPPAIAANASAPRTGLLVSIGRKIRVLLADDHAVMRQGLAALLQEERDIEVIGQAADGWEALELARLLKPDVVIMDVTMPRLGGLDATRLISAEMPEVRVVGLSLHDAADMAKAMHEAGARTYLSKSDPVEDLIAAIRGC